MTRFVHTWSSTKYIRTVPDRYAPDKSQPAMSRSVGSGSSSSGHGERSPRVDQHRVTTCNVFNLNATVRSIIF